MTRASCIAAGFAIPLFYASASLQQATPPRVLVLENVTVIDGTGTPPQSGMDVVIDGDRIQQVVATGVARPPGAEVLELDGRFVVPGLVDSHIHLMHRYRVSRAYAYRELERMLYGGVVAAREMAGDIRFTPEAARSVLLGDAPGPDLYYAAVLAGPDFFDEDPRPRAAARGLRAGALPWSQAVSAGTDVSLAVTRAAGSGAAGLKLYSQIAPPLLRRITAEAHRQGLLAWSHATVYPGRPMDAVTAGMDSITHTCGLVWESRALDPAQFAKPSVNNRPRFDPSVVKADAPEMAALFEEMHRRGTIFEPTMAIHLRPSDDQFGCTTELMTALARAAHKTGVVMSTGTDFVAADDDPYPALHAEIEALVSTGILSPLEAITAATLNGAKALGLEKTQGTIEPGRLANLVVLERNPTRDIGALRSVVTVIKRGASYSRTNYKPGFSN